MSESLHKIYNCYFKYKSLAFLGIYMPGIKNIPANITVQELFRLVDDPLKYEDSLWTTKWNK